MNSVPQTNPSPVHARSMTDSKAQNEFEKQVYNDLLSLYNKANLLELELENTKEIVEIESQYMKKSAVRNQTLLANVLENFVNSGAETQTKTIFPSAMVGIAPHPVRLDPETFDVTLLPVQTESKVNVYDELYNETFVPDSLKVELLHTPSPSILSVVDNDVYQCFDKKDDTAWVRKITTDNTVNEVLTVMNIYLPYDMVTTDLVNELVIKPFPVNSIDIKEIRYSSTYDINYTTILDDLHTVSKNVLKDYRSYLGEDYNECFNLRLNFPEKKMKILTISFSQKSYVQNDGYRVFYIGAKEIQVNLNKYSNQYGEFEYIIDLGDIRLKQINSLVPSYNNFSMVVNEEILTQDFYLLDENDNETLVEESLPFSTTSQRLKIKAKLYPTVSRNTPNLSKMKLSYKFL